MSDPGYLSPDAREAWLRENAERPVTMVDSFRELGKRYDELWERWMRAEKVIEFCGLNRHRWHWAGCAMNDKRATPECDCGWVEVWNAYRSRP